MSRHAATGRRAGRARRAVTRERGGRRASGVGRGAPNEPVARIRDRRDALELVKAARTRVPAGVDLVVLLEPDGGWIDAFPMEPGTPLPDVVEMCASRLVPGAALVIVTNRTGEVPADRPDDELLWEELGGIARSHGTHLLDWFVFSGQWAFSVTEFSPSGDGWSSFRPVDHPCDDVG